MFSQQEMILDCEKEEFFCPHQTKKNNYETHDFFFPSRQLINQSLTIQDLVMMKQSANFMKIIKKGIYIYFKCKLCSAHMNFKEQEGTLKIIKSSNIHNHQNNGVKKIQEQQIIKFYEEKNSLSPPSVLKKEIMNLFAINSKRYDYIIGKKMHSSSWKEIQSKFVKNGFECRADFEENQQFPSLFLALSFNMKRWAEIFGSVISFDLTYNIIKGKNYNGRQWALGFFATTDANLRIVPIGVALMTDQSSKSFEKIFRQFFLITGIRHTSIITDEQQAISSALKNLKSDGSFLGQHYLDSFHLLRNIKRKVPKSQFSQYCQLIKTDSRRKFDEIVQILQKTTEKPKVLQNILKNSEKFCYSQSGKHFVGFSLSSSISEKLNDLIKTMAPTEINFGKFYSIISRIEKYTLAKMITIYELKPYQKLFSDPNLLRVREKLQKKIFHKFIMVYTVALRVTSQKVKKLGENHWIIQQFKVFNDHCQCQMQIKNGLPCHHLLRKEFQTQQFKYMKYISWRWTHTFEFRSINQMGRGKNTRRNR